MCFLPSKAARVSFSHLLDKIHYYDENNRAMFLRDSKLKMFQTKDSPVYVSSRTGNCSRKMYLLQFNAWYLLYNKAKYLLQCKSKCLLNYKTHTYYTASQTCTYYTANYEKLKRIHSGGIPDI